MRFILFIMAILSGYSNAYAYARLEDLNVPQIGAMRGTQIFSAAERRREKNRKRVEQRNAKANQKRIENKLAITKSADHDARVHKQRRRGERQARQADQGQAKKLQAILKSMRDAIARDDIQALRTSLISLYKFNSYTGRLDTMGQSERYYWLGIGHFALAQDGESLKHAQQLMLQSMSLGGIEQKHKAKRVIDYMGLYKVSAKTRVGNEHKIWLIDLFNGL